MRSSTKQVEYHLRPTGWLLAPMKFDPVEWIAGDTPPDRLLTVTFQECEFSGLPGRASARVEAFADRQVICEALARFGAEPHPDSTKAQGWSDWIERAQSAQTQTD